MEMAFIEFKELNMLSFKCGNLDTNNRLVEEIPLGQRASEVLGFTG